MPRNRLIPGLALVALVAALGAWYAATRLRPAPLNGTLLPPGAAADFTLTGAGGPVRLSDFRGRAVLLFFGYTSCPDICPLTLAKLDRALHALGTGREDVQVLLVSVDPEVDTPDRLRGYVRRFDPSFIGLAGSRTELTGVARTFGVFAGEVEPGGHGAHADPARVIPHTAHVLGLDRAGRFRMLWSPDLTAGQIAADLPALLRL